MQFPVNINNRIAYGLASMSLGGKDTKTVPDFCLSAADFPLTSEEEFDSWSGCADLKLEKRPKPPMTLNAWYRNALREAWAIACVYGSEHYSSFEQAATYLLRLGEEHAYMWPAHAIISVWEELWSRYVEELKDLDRELRRAMKEEPPTFERIRFFVTAPGPDGEPWLRLPRTFFLEDTLEYFQTDIIPRHNRLLSRAYWQVALKRAPGGNLHGGKAGEDPEASESRPGSKAGKAAESQLKGLLGPPLTNKEAARALDHRPKEKKGAKYLCWDHLCHRGCSKPSACPHSHGTVPKWEQLDWSVQLQLLRRGGLRNQPKLSENQVVEQMECIRKAQQAKTQEMVNEGKKTKKVGGDTTQSEPNTDSKVGECLSNSRSEQDPPPEEFTNIHPTDQEADMAALLEGPDHTFFHDHDQGKPTREMSTEGMHLGEDVVKREERMREIDKADLVTGFDEQLKTYVKNQLLLKKEEDPTRALGLEDVRQALEQARSYGCPALSTAADEALQGAVLNRAGYSPNLGQLSQFTWDGNVGHGTLAWSGGSWDVWGFGDKLYPSGDWTKELLSHDPGDTGPEARQCLLLHCSAGYLYGKHGKVPTWEDVQKCTNEMRGELIAQASEASRHLGEFPDTMPRSEADLRVFVHDLLHWSHDKDYRTLASFPSGHLLDRTLHVIRMASDGDLSTEVITGALSSGHVGQQIHLLVHQGHMRLLVPRAIERHPPIIREVIAAGWECHLEAAHGSEALVRARDYLLCPRCAQSEEAPRRSGSRPPSVLGLHLRSDASEKFGEWTPGILETKDLPTDEWTDEELAEWLGPQAAVFQQALLKGLDFLEVYAGKARTSQAVTAHGGLAIHLGLDHGQDFRRARDRSLGRALVQRLKPKHLWGAFPCTPFCAWIRLAILRNCDMTLRLKEGRVHLGFILDLCELQISEDRDAHLENPLTSLAWKEPIALRVLADPRWLRARLDQCQTGLSSPLGGLHLKPTLIRWQEANRGIRRTWVETNGDHFEGLHSDFFDGLVSPNLLEKARENATWGISARYEGGVGDRVQCGPHPSLKEHLEEAAQQLWKDASKGRVLLCFDEGGDELRGVVSVAMARVPKMLPDRTISSKGRVIWDAKPINEFCDKNRHPPALQPKHDEVARLIVWWKARYPNTPILMSKKDVSDAFKWIPVRSEDTRLFAADLPGGEFGAPGKSITVLYNSLTFGWTGAPGEYMLFAWLIKLGHSMFHPPDTSWNDSAAFQSLVLMDDAVLIEPKIGLRPWMSVQTMETCTRKALGDGAINVAKDEIEGSLETRKLIWGLLYDTEKNTRALPPQKLEKASYLLHLPEFDHGNTKVPLKLVQELRGNQQFWVSVLPSLKPLLSASNALLGPPTSEGLAQPRGDAEQRRRIWVRFWEAIELQRLLVDNRAECGVRFTHPMTEALTVRELLAMPGHQHKIVWASGDATLDRVGAVDWTHKKAYSLEVQPYHRMIESMEREALEDVSYPRRVSRPGDDIEAEESGKLMVALTELLAVLLLAVCQHEQWRGKTVLYMGDNQVVVKWINSRQAKHPFASYLLQVLAAIEACYGFHMHTAYLRTYHNVVADALTRKDAEEVIREAGLEALPQPDEALRRFLDRGWQRRALVWAGQADADSEQACRLAETPNPTGPPKALIGPAVLEVCFVDLGELSHGYPAALSSSGAQPLAKDRSFPWRASRLGQPIIACVTLNSKEWKGSLNSLLRSIAEWEVDLLWVDSRDRVAVTEFGNELTKRGFFTTIRSLCGRSLRDQVWWKRWVMTASQREELPFDWVVADDEPCTPPLAGYSLDWLAEDGQIDSDLWETGLLKVDSSMPYLGATKPKPAGTLQRPREGRALIWDPKKPLPGLHEGSCDTQRKDRLLLLGKGPDGPAARTILPEEVVKLVGGHKPHSGVDPEEEVKKALIRPPRTLCELAVRWAASQVDQKVGVCQLPWEEESRRVLEKWLTENPATPGHLIVGGRGKRSKNQDLPLNEQAMKAMSYVLRHAAGTRDCPINEEGWIRWDDLRSHESCQRFGAWTLWEAIEIDAKDRVVAKQDDQGNWWVAAWSGHTVDRVVGPAAIVPSRELPDELVHGSYRKHTASIQKKGLLRKSRDIHLHDPRATSGKWRLDLETKVEVDVRKACELGCVFRKTGNDVWLCDRNIPVEAILSIGEWDDLGARGTDPEGSAEPASSSGAQGPEVNSAALNLRAYRSGSWQPKLEPRAVTEELALTACDLGKNLPENLQGGIEVDTETGIVKSTSTEARIAPGSPGGEDECDWSAEDSDVEVVQAIAASDPSPKGEPKMEVDEGVTMAKGEEEDLGATPEAGRAREEEDVDMEESRASDPSKTVEEVVPKAEEIIEEEPQTMRRRKIRFGSAHLHLLKAVADADAQNWESLQTAINSAPESAQAKSELVSRLEHLADLRVQSMVAAEKRAQEHAQRAKHYTEAETEYQRGLNDAMLRLEKMNPVGPRTSVPLISDARLRQDIEAGKPIWQARREHRARERAAKHRQATTERTTLDTSQPSRLTEVSPSEGGEVLDEAFAASAKANLAEFKQVLKEEARGEKKGKPRQADSDRRKKIKKDRRKAKKANSKDDSERDRNHAIAHETKGSGASFSPGLRGAILAVTVGKSQGRKFAELAGDSGEYLGDRTDGEFLLDKMSGVLFDLGTAMLLLGMLWLCLSVSRLVQGKVRSWWKDTSSTQGFASPARRVGGTRKKVWFSVPTRGKVTQPPPETPFLGGPRAASRKHPPGKPFRLATIQGRQEYEQAGLSLLLSRYAQSTATNYQSQWSWWVLFCRRRGEEAIRHIPMYSRAEEDLILDYLVHCATNEAKAPGTIKLRLAAIRSMHLTLGYPDPLAHMPRVPLALAGLRRRFGTKERRMPVTPEMLKWLGEHLQYGRSQEASLLWGALVLGFFFLLRASEYLDVGYQDPKRGLRGSDITLKLNGKALSLERLSEADEVTILVRGSKTDIYNRGQVRNHFRTSERVCVVKAMVNLFHQFPQRYQGGSEAEELLFRSLDDRPIPRAAIQALIERAAKGLNLPNGDLGTHSLRFGGASALWAQYQDTALVKRWGRWSSDSFQTYIWEARETAKGVTFWEDVLLLSLCEAYAAEAVWRRSLAPGSQFSKPAMTSFLQRFVGYMMAFGISFEQGRNSVASTLRKNSAFLGPQTVQVYSQLLLSAYEVATPEGTMGTDSLNIAMLEGLPSGGIAMQPAATDLGGDDFEAVAFGVQADFSENPGSPGVHTPSAQEASDEEDEKGEETEALRVLEEAQPKVDDVFT
eukprot:s1779_g9.t1